MRRNGPTSAAILAAAASAIATLRAPVPSDSFSPSPLPSLAARVPTSFERRDAVARLELGRRRATSRRGSGALRISSAPPAGIENRQGQLTELPDSLTDAAAIAANACQELYATSGTTVRCRVDFDTSIGDETYTTQKSTTEFMQQFVSSLCLASVDGVMEWRQDGVMKLVQAKAELMDLREEMEEMGLDEGDDDDDDVDFGEYPGDESSAAAPPAAKEGAGGEDRTEEANRLAAREDELVKIIANDGTDPSRPWTGPTVRIYFPDEGSAALARRDWQSRVPPCVEFASCGGVRLGADDGARDAIILFYCPRASEAIFVEETLLETEARLGEGLRMAVMVNPLLVDMGVTGFGMAGRRLRERLIDPLVPAYYLRTLPWGALTRTWPQLFTVWQEDEVAEGGYRMIKSMDRLPSNPEVEDIYDIENGNMDGPQEGFGLLNALGDFVNGMMSL